MTLNLDGSVKSEIRYKAWGETRFTSGTTPTDRQYTGQINESEAELYFYNARWDASPNPTALFRSLAVRWGGIGTRTR